ncbi:MAG: flagellar hook-associated protein FlgK [Clostridiales bacterium]|jgi:flagellar hook-associated protein 1 FlgK|nr:flagellar hook-associated protein FlgK [Clostridiales bacterium]
MRSAFFEFNVAASGLFTARGGLEVTSHNVANAAAPGYSRQIPKERATWPITYYDGRGMVGTGSEVYGVDRMRDRFLDLKYWRDSSVMGEYGVKSAHMGVFEGIFAEMSDSGTLSGFDKFFQSMQDLSTTAGDDSYRASLLQAANGLSRFINQTAGELKKRQREVNAEVAAVTRRISGVGARIAALNGRIKSYEMDGSNANDLRDERDRLLDELSSYVNIETYETPSKDFEVTINGDEFVKGDFSRQLYAVARDLPLARNPGSGARRNPWDAEELYDIHFETGAKLDIYSATLKGRLKGLIDVRDGNNEYFMRGSVSDAESVGNMLVVYADADGRLDIARFGAGDGKRGAITVNDALGLPVELTYDACSFNPALNRYEFQITSHMPALVPNSPVTSGETTSYKGIAHYIDKLNELTRVFAKAVNEGLDRNGAAIPGVTGYVNGFDANGESLNKMFFTAGANFSDYLDMTGENFTVNNELMANPALIAAASGDDGESANQIALEFLELKNFQGLFDEGKLSDYIISVAAELGAGVRQADRFDQYYGDVVVETDNLRKSVSGVDVNDEMMNLVKFQQLYQAASKLINVVDFIYEFTVNKLGVT